MLVFHQLKEEETRREGRLVLVAEKLEDIMATVFRQAVLTRFEQSLHRERRNQGELTTARISELWIEANSEMFGDSVALTENYACWWLYIPPFHTLSLLLLPRILSASCSPWLLYGMFLERGRSFVPDYMGLLRSGGSASPAELLSGVGVDINDPGFWQTGLDVIGAMVDEVEELAEQSGLG